MKQGTGNVERFINYLNKNRVLVGIFLFGVSFFGYGFVANSQVFADCGAHGSIHDYAGAVIDVRAVTKNGNVIEVGNAVRVTTSGGSYSGGNVVHLGNGPEGVDQRISSATFNQIGNGCRAGFGGQSVVLGYGTTSNGGNWALDCDISRRPSSDPIQSFTVTGIGTPAGLSATSAAQAADGYGWTTQTIKPLNGTTSYTAVIYKEPPDPPKQQSQYEWDYDMWGYSDCTFVRGYSRLIWTRPADGVRQNIIPEYRVIWNGQVLRNWTRTGINGASDRNNPDSFRFIVNFGAGTGANIWGSTGGDQPFQIQTRFIGGAVQQGPVSKTTTVFAKNCANSGVSGTASGNCNVINVSGLNDSDRADVPYGYIIYELDAGGGTGNEVARGGGSGRGNFSLPISPDEQNGVNNGFLVVFNYVDMYGSGEAVPGGYREARFNTGNCYAGTCKITSIQPTIPGASGYAVEATKQFNVTYSISQAGAQRQVPAGSISMTVPTVAGWPGLDPGPTPHLGASGTFPLTAPNTVQSYNMAFYPDWWGLMPIGPACTITTDVYKHFDITPKADTVTLDPYIEDPLTATFTSSTIKNNPSGTSIPGVVATRKIARNGTQIGSFNAPNPYRAGVPSDTRNFSDTANIPQPNKLNDGFCGQITVAPAAGWIGPSDKVVVTVANASDSTPGCTGITVNPPGGPNGGELVPKVVNQPYVKSYGGDVVAGGGFQSTGGSCAATPSSGTGIFSFIAPLGSQASRNRSGSGSQFGAFAWGANVSGFTSASMRTTAPTSAGGNKLTFANTATGDPASEEPILGGNLTGAPPCLPDYFNDTQYPEGDYKDIGSATSVSVASLASNKQTVFTGNTQITGSTNYKSRHTVYVDGDAWISDNIIYSRTAVAEAIKMPNFTLVVKGNIYIDKNVNRLDGTYIAQPLDDGSKGIIYTCSTGFNAILAPDAMFSQCGAGGGARQLYVYGSFIAEKVRLNRTINSLKNSSYREDMNRTAAAEVFNFSPDVYLSPPVFRPNSTVTSGDYQYIATLPPIL